MTADDPPRTYADAFCDAARDGRADDVRRWLARGIDVDVLNRYGRTALSVAEDVEVMRALLEAGASIERAGPTLLHGWVDAACDTMTQAGRDEPYPGMMQILRLLLSHGADPFARDSTTKTALDVARLYRCEPVIRLLAGERRGVLGGK